MNLVFGLATVVLATQTDDVALSIGVSANAASAELTKYLKQPTTTPSPIQLTVVNLGKWRFVEEGDPWLLDRMRSSTNLLGDEDWSKGPISFSSLKGVAADTVKNWAEHVAGGTFAEKDLASAKVAIRPSSTLFFERDGKRVDIPLDPTKNSKGTPRLPAGPKATGAPSKALDILQGHGPLRPDWVLTFANQGKPADRVLALETYLRVRGAAVKEASAQWEASVLQFFDKMGAVKAPIGATMSTLDVSLRKSVEDWMRLGYKRYGFENPDQALAFLSGATLTRASHGFSISGAIRGPTDSGGTTTSHIRN